MKNTSEEFSIVIPIKGTTEELMLIPRTLPSYYALKPSELILSIDDPPEDDRIMPLIESIIRRWGGGKTTRLLRIRRGGEGWGDQQMKARHTGFLEARFDRILTGDIDLMVNRNVLRAVELVGKNRIGLVSCSKLRSPRNFLSFYRLFCDTLLRNVVHRFTSFGATNFAGLYAVWKPYWMEVEPTEMAKGFVKLKAKVRDGKPIEMIDFYGAGDDTFVRDLMLEKYGCIYLKEIGAVVTTDFWEERPIIQYGKGVYFAGRGRKLFVSLMRSVIRAQPYYFCGYVHARRIKGVTRFSSAWIPRVKGGA